MSRNLTLEQVDDLPSGSVIEATPAGQYRRGRFMRLSGFPGDANGRGRWVSADSQRGTLYLSGALRDAVLIVTPTTPGAWFMAFVGGALGKECIIVVTDRVKIESGHIYAATDPDDGRQVQICADDIDPNTVRLLAWTEVPR